MTKFNPHGYTVIFDSSSLYGDPIARQICGLIEKYKVTDKVDIKVYIPEVVEKELERRIIDEVLSKHKQILKGLGVLKAYFPEIQTNIPDEVNIQDVLKAKDRILAQIGIEVIPTPTNRGLKP